MQHETNYMEQFPRAAVEIRDGAISAVNAAACAHLPELAVGTRVPDALAELLAGQSRAGKFRQSGETYLYSRIAGSGVDLILFQPDPGSGAVSSGQLEGFSRKMREQLGAYSNLLEKYSRRSEDDTPDRDLTRANRSLYQMLHLVSDLDFLNIPDEKAAQLFHPVTMDLAGLAHETVQQAAPMLLKAGVTLSLRPGCAGLLIPGDPELCRRMLLALISNAAKAAADGGIWVEVRRLRDRAILSVSDSTREIPDLAALFEAPDPDRIPAPEEGAGMGLSIVRRIAALHGGTLLSQSGQEGGINMLVSLPTGPLDPSLSFCTPRAEEDAGFSPFLVGLADVLPEELFVPDFD